MLKPRRLPAGLRLDERLRSYINHPDIVAVFIGKKQKNSKNTGRLSVVFGVQKKIARKELERNRMLPKFLEMGAAPGWESRIPTDVVEVEGQLEIQANQVGPADMVNPGLPLEATIGIALRHPEFGNVVTTAGHAIPQGLGSGSRLMVRSAGADFLAEVKRVVTNDVSDHALLRPENQDLVTNSFRDVTPLGPPYIPDPDHDVGTQLYVLPANRDRLPTICRGLKGSVSIGHIVMSNLILTDPVTEGGDSGSCLVDSRWRAWGLLLGKLRTRDNRGVINDFSVFVPAFRVLFMENARFL
ncbi:MAG TPA: hypothetical protein VGG03_19390 [Thermoanaerobaculia bacterium]